MNPNALDVQLLQVFEALMAERNVTKAARQLGLSQSAVSHALGRLRERLDDPLLVRTSNGMAPTPRALELVGPVRHAVRQVEEVFRSEPRFEPASSRESFVIRIGDSNEFVLLPALIKELEAKAPHASLVVRHLSPDDTVKALEDGSIDCAVSALLRHPKSVRATALMRDRMVCAMSRNHPLARQTLTTERFLALRHIRVVQDAGDSRFVDEALRERRVTRKVVATIPHWVVALHAVSTCEMVVAASERMALHFDTGRQLVLKRLPVGGDPFAWQLYWHRRHETQPAQRWMRKLLVDVCKAIESPSGASR